MDEKEKKKHKKSDNPECKCEDCTCEKCECDGETCKCEDCKDNDEIEELKGEIVALQDKCARAQAEVINFKRRKEEETALRLKYCNEEILTQFVQIVDNFERAIQMDDDNLSDEVSKYLQGFKMMYTNMLEILKANEVVEIEVLNKPFDPKTSEALLVEHFDDREPQEVVDVLQKGYMYKDKVLRPAMVKVND